MYVALLIHRPPTPPRSRNKSLSNKLPSNPPNNRAQFVRFTKSAETTAAAAKSASITTQENETRAETQIFIIHTINSKEIGHS